MSGVWLYISRIPYYVRASIWLLLGFGYAAWFFKYRAQRVLQLPAGTVLERKQQRRLKQYFYGTSYLSFLFSMLRGNTRSKEERFRFIQLSALAYHFDDLADTWQTSRNTGKSYHGTIKDYGRQADQSGLALHLLNNVEQNLEQAQTQRFEAYMERVFKVETDGRQIRQGTQLDSAVLMELTREKGGCSVLMFRMMQQDHLGPAEEKLWYHFGGLIQLADDIFDVWFDHQEGVTTLACTSVTPEQVVQLKHTFEAEVSTTYATLMACPQGKMDKLTTWYGMHYLIAITRLCLEHYYRLATEFGTLPVHDRHALVVDMEQWSNRIATIKFVFRLR
jgi:hypothetical protein